MVLRIPETVNDVRLLEDEPFKKHFTDEINSGRVRRQRPNTRRPLFKNIEEALRSESGGLDAARAWLRTVFTFNSEPRLESEDLDVFIEFYWILRQGGGARSVEPLLLTASRSRDLPYTCPLDKPIVLDPRESQETNSTRPISLANVSAPKEKKPRHKRARAAKRRKNEPQNAYDGEPEDNDSDAELNVDASISAPMAPRNPSVPPPFVSAPVCRHTASAKSATTRPGRERKRKAITPPPGHGASSDGLAELSSLTSLESDAEDATPTRLSSPVMAYPQRPKRQASNAARLSDLIAMENDYEKMKSKCRKGKSHVPGRQSAPPVPKVPREPTTPIQNVPSKAATVKACSSLALKPSDKCVRASAPISRRTQRSPRRSAVSAKKPKFDADVGSTDGRPVKKRRGSGGDTLVDTPTSDSVSVPVKRSRESRARVQTAPPIPFTGSSASCKAPISTVFKERGRSQGCKRAREQEIAEQSQSAKASEVLQERLIIRIRPRRQAAIAATALNAEYAKADAEFKKQPDKLGLVDIVFRDTARSAPMYSNCRDPEASDWTADLDDTQPGDSGDEDTPLATGLRRTVAEQVAAPPPHSAAQDQASGPQETRILEEGKVDEPTDAYVRRQDEQFELVYPQLTHCPVFDSTLNTKPFAPKLPLLRLPPIWAQSRQEVCESCDWFRSYQGGVYFVKDLVRGYLLSAFSASRDLFHNGGKLIISHGGGKAGQSLAKAPGTVRASDQQEDDKSVRALLHNYRIGRPLVLIVDDKYSLFPYDLAAKGVTYAVLGWYQIAHAWAELQADASSSTGKVVRWKFAFQWCDAQGSPWWSDSCPTTGKTVHEYKCPWFPSPQVYDVGWMCLRPRCPVFWYFRSAIEAPTSLSYAASFLRPVTISADQILEDLRPGLPVAGVPIDRITTGRHFCKGLHCTNCGRLSSRYKWEHWECRSCSFTYAVPGRLREAREFRSQKSDKMDKHTHQPSLELLPLAVFRSGKALGQRATFKLPGERGYIHVLFAAPNMNQEADITLREYQEQAATGQLEFRRWPLRSHKCRGTLLANYFSQNSKLLQPPISSAMLMPRTAGAPYHYIAGDENTVPFDRAPSAVNRALNLIKQRIQEAGLDIPPTFNEVLTAAYMEKQKMAFHSDAERGLGPNVASLSLGAAAHMHFRLHAQYAGEIQPSQSRDVLTLFLKHASFHFSLCEFPVLTAR
ncbi:uncharacterized protein PHACADRAFT_185468 [Phanerochaete carnosa HHB-10118-sp]|uniref:Alpha-ketoglutarate-dependent dioxygenase AlkB-like domain-containing protein n=1 Tax=Phanerochaete carnosa (strain HHB-10118-sp) TaxID=650164 RepID=K5W6H7_PHACS|nr:uncharacterized protein PHACADRAFT_185468 [Phanerochaete carnosa HHB-10118-sp]EKM54554.1 hypothetical protein PHACADRAFT_185468 [Phanerochaete carnosa HHB-10118-sp]